MTDPGSRPAGAADFDFLLGNWIVAHRRLRTRLSGDDRWETFTGTMTAQPILLGQGNFDQNVIHLPAGTYRACTLRIFHPAEQNWSIHWIDGRHPKIDPPMTGSFADGIGTFHGSDQLDGRRIDVRFLWSRITRDSAEWRQAFSGDGGRMWETNWVMEFARA